MTEERRTSSRKTVLQKARIVLPGGMSTMPCIVTDLGDGGAKIRSDQWLFVPESFQLKMDNGNSYTTMVRYRDMDCAGLEFI